MRVGESLSADSRGVLGPQLSRITMRGCGLVGRVVRALMGQNTATSSCFVLSADGRYFLQAEQECCGAASEWKLMKWVHQDEVAHEQSPGSGAGVCPLSRCALHCRDRLPETPSIEDWLALTLTKGQTVGIDPLVMTLGSVRRLETRLQRAGVGLSTAAHVNLVDQV